MISVPTFVEKEFVEYLQTAAPLSIYCSVIPDSVGCPYILNISFPIRYTWFSSFLFLLHHAHGSFTFHCICILSPFPSLLLLFCRRWFKSACRILEEPQPSQNCIFRPLDNIFIYFYHLSFVMHAIFYSFLFLLSSSFPPFYCSFSLCSADGSSKARKGFRGRSNNIATHSGKKGRTTFRSSNVCKRSTGTSCSA
jgi:hypothetical protein